MIHYARKPFVAFCGANEPGQHTSDADALTSCPTCLSALLFEARVVRDRAEERCASKSAGASMHNAEVRPFGELLAVVGSRAFARREDVDNFVHATTAETVIVTGCARDGVDSWARDAARRFGRILVIIEAPRTVHGRKAGPMRNPVIAWIAERLIAFRTPVGTKSNGTDNVVEWADEFGKTREVRS